MCGVPYHAAEGYISKLIKKGYKVAICDQMEDPRLARKLVKRAVTRVVTPGTAADSSLSCEENNFLAAVARLDIPHAVAGFAVLDLSTGEFRATEFAGDGAQRRVVEELEQLRPREVLFGSSLPLFELSARGATRSASGWAETPLEDWVFSPDYAIPLVENHFGVLSLEGFGLAGRPAAAAAANASGGMSPSTSRAPDCRSQRASDATRASHSETNSRQASTVACSSITSASFCTRPTSPATCRSSSGGATTPANRSDGAVVLTAIGSPGAR
jgi:DNA mismatch repair ATPase MutS